MGLHADLIAYYEAEAAARRRVGQGAVRAEMYEDFRDLASAEGCRRVVDVGAGPGLDTALWQRDGFEVVGVDLAFGNVEAMRDRGLVGVAGSLYHLPFCTDAFDAVWTMSTFVHVPDEQLADAFRELKRVARPGAPLGIGTWGGWDYEGVPEFGDLRPYRFFALRSHEHWCETLAEHGRIDKFITVESTSSDRWEYQFAIVRAPD